MNLFRDLKNVSKRPFFKSRNKFITIVHGNSCNPDSWKGVSKTNLIYSTAVCGLEYARIVAYLASERVRCL